MARRNRDEGPLLANWRPERASGSSAMVKLWLRRSLLTLVAIGLVGGLGYLVARPFFQPHTYFLCFHTEPVIPDLESQIELENSLSAPPLRYYYEDIAGFARLQDAFAALRPSNLQLSSDLPTADALDAYLTVLKQAEIDDKDTLVVYVVAHGIAINEPAAEGESEAKSESSATGFLVCGDFSAKSTTLTEETPGLFKIDDLLRGINALPGATKLLLLDAGRLEPAFGRPYAAGDFDMALKDAVEDLGSSSLFVLTANGPGEISHISPALQRSVFGFMLTRGMSGAASSDGKRVDVERLADFVQRNVSQWVNSATNGTISQSPQLIAAAAARSRAASGHVMFTAGLPQESDSVGLEATKEQATGSALKSAGSFFADRMAGFGYQDLYKNWSSELSYRTGIGADKPTNNVAAEGEEVADNDVIVGAAREQARQERQQLLADCWDATLQIESEQFPHEYAPHLWRLHLDRLVWLDQLQDSGDMPIAMEDALGQSLRDISTALKLIKESQTVAEMPRDSVLGQVIALRPTVPFEWDEVPTLALAELTALPQPIIEAIAEYDRWLNSPELVREPTRFNELRAALSDSQRRVVDGFYEMQLLSDFAAIPNLSANTVKLALRARRIGEQVSADRLAGRGWAAASIAEADWLRLEAERLLIDQVNDDAEQRAISNLGRAIRRYQDAELDLLAVRETMTLAGRVSLHLRDIGVVDSLTGSPIPLPSLRDRLEAIATSDPLADTGSINSISEMRSSAAELKSLLANARRAMPIVAEDKTDILGWKTERALTSTLLTATDRQALRKKWRETDLAHSKNFKILRDAPNSPLPTTLSLGRGELIDVGLTTVAMSPIPDFDSSEFDLSNANQRLEQMRSLRTAAQNLYFLSTDSLSATVLGDDKKSSLSRMLGTLNDADWYDLARMQHERLLRGYQDSNQHEIDKLEVLARQCRDLVENHLDNQPKIAIAGLPSVELRVVRNPTGIIGENDDVIEIAVSNRSNTEAPVWIVADYNPSVIAVEGDGWPLFHAHELLSAGGRTAERTGYPLRPATLGKAPSDNLGPLLRDKTLRILVHQAGTATDGRAAIAIRLVGPSDSVRSVVPLRLPRDKQLQLWIADGSSQPVELQETTNLFPNRWQDATLFLSNGGNSKRSLVVNVYAPLNDLSGVYIPRGAIPSTDAPRLRARLGRMRDIATDAAVPDLNPTEPPRPVQFDFRSERNSLLLGRPPADPKQGPAAEILPHGLLIEVVDAENEERMYRWLKFEAWRPQQFITAEATYDPTFTAPRLRIKLSKNPEAAAMPLDPIEARLDIDQRFVSSEGKQDRATLRGPNFTGELSVTLNGIWPKDIDVDDENFIRAAVEIDGFPRSFKFEITPSTTAARLKLIDNKNEIRVIAPEERQAFQPSKTVSARFAVDAEPNFFDERDQSGQRSNSIKFGIDADLDNNLTDVNESPLERFADRSVELTVRSSIDGTLSFRPSVSDWTLELPNPVSSGEINVLGQFWTGRSSLDPTYHRIIIDGDGPTIERVPGGEFANGKLIAEVEPKDQIEVVSVEAGFDQTGDQEIKWEKAVPLVGGRWRVELDASKLSAGNHKVLFRAKDKLGNWTDPPIREDYLMKVGVSPPEPPDPDRGNGGGGSGSTATKEPVKNRVTGTLVYNQVAVRDIEVTLEGPGAPAGKARDLGGGKFEFDAVPSGTYTLSASGLGGGSRRSGQAEVTVSDQPGTTADIKVRIR